MRWGERQCFRQGLNTFTGYKMALGDTKVDRLPAIPDLTDLSRGGGADVLVETRFFGY